MDCRWASITPEISAALVPKCGSDSLSGLPLADGSEPCRILFMRDPIDRLASGYWFFRQLMQDGVEYPDFDIARIDSYKSYVDIVLREDDPHWLPQTSLAEGFTEAMPLLGMTEYVYCLTGRILSRENIGPSIPVDSYYRQEELREYYADDYGVITWL